MKDKKRVYLFEEGNKDMRDSLGGKGANLAEMSNLGLPVPPGFTITSEVCLEYLEDEQLPAGLMEEVKEALSEMERRQDKGFGNPAAPLLVSVRSGAKFSMPGMMDTVLNLGLNDETVEGLADLTSDRGFAYDAYRRLIMMFGDVVLGVDRREHFEPALERLKERLGVSQETEIEADGWRELVEEYKQIIRREVKRDFPQEPWEQLELTIRAVFESWNTPRAVAYRKLNKIPDDLGTAVNVQAMVFGNMGADSGTGVVFTRDSATGEKRLYGDYLSRAQGEDVVAGIRVVTPLEQLKEDMPEIYAQLDDICELLERHYRDMQDIEFTVEQGKLYILQTRTGKRSAQAELKIAVDMAKEGLISKGEAVGRVTPDILEMLMHPQIDPAYEGEPLATGVVASPGAASGKVVFDTDKAEERGRAGEAIILVRAETNPDDVHGLAYARGVLTARGGMVSHAAIVARGMGKPAVVGCQNLLIEEEAGRFVCDEKVVEENDLLTIDGGSGAVFLGEAPMVPPKTGEEFEQLLGWADDIRRLQVWTNADTPQDAKAAYGFGAEGIGLCRTEHMFMASERLPVVQAMIMADEEGERREALEKVLPMQKQDFVEIFKAMKGLPVTIRLLDPPLHEFLPSHEELTEEIADLRLEAPDSPELAQKEEQLNRVEALREANPMLGLRGCRLGILYPEINEMQVRAIFEAAIEVKKEGMEVRPEVMIPLVGHANELKKVRGQLETIAQEVMEEAGVRVEYAFGTMIEIPRAAMTADEIAEHAEFFSFGTNDLTQTVYGMSRDDAEGKFIIRYLSDGILPFNPFESIDREGVGKVMRVAVELGRKRRADLKIGICGEHGGDPDSIEFCEEIGLDYVSCAPPRVPIARLAAAHAVLGGRRVGKGEEDV